MTARARILLMAGIVAALAAILAVREWRETRPAGMTDTPCAANGSSVTGEAADDWARLCAFRKANAGLRESGLRPEIVMIGDSITAFWPSGNRTFVNRGISAQTSAQVLLRFRQDAVSLQPRIVHILVGSNDIAGNAGPVSPEMFKDNIRTMAEIAKAHGIGVILGTIPPTTGFDWAPAADPGRWTPILNTWLRQFAGANDLVLADYHAALSDGEGRIDERLFEDGVHPNARGYAAMNRVLSEAIRELEGLRTKSDPQAARRAL